MKVISPQKPIVRTKIYRAGKFEFPLGLRTYLVGILNVTPDSFSDGGRYFDHALAVEHARRMLELGADIIDVGGESTRPGSIPIDAETELARVIPVVEKIRKACDCPISVDTGKSTVARAALEAGASIINDINGLQADPCLAPAIARHQAGVILMHNARLYRGGDESAVPGQGLIAGVRTFLKESCRIAAEAGVLPDNMMLDPGIGFGVTAEESIRMIACLEELQDIGLPILIGPSRKRFIGHILGHCETDRLIGTCAAVVMGIARGADFVRVHDVREIAEAARVADAIERASPPERRRRR